MEKSLESSKIDKCTALDKTTHRPDFFPKKNKRRCLLIRYSSIVLPTFFAASVFTFQVFSSNSLTLKVRKNQFIIQVTKLERFYCLGQKVAD